uniref:Dynein cytoplasmic 1 intermediate chain 1 n=1 Tax=Pipistrellus kuhlii TaxID=59472 RepID=A0A7J7WL60_PIPKU|nr:dynein cytoplasmic 1 intermediate chain 1 [Pipistrellus kuhlii]
MLESLRCPTTMNGPDLPGPSWRSVLTELTARRKAPWSWLPSGSEPPHPQVLLLEFSLHSPPSHRNLCPFSISVAVTFWVPYRASFALNLSHPGSTNLKFTRAFLSLYFCLEIKGRGWGGGGTFTGLVVAFQLLSSCI